MNLENAKNTFSVEHTVIIEKFLEQFNTKRKTDIEVMASCLDLTLSGGKLKGLLCFRSPK